MADKPNPYRFTIRDLLIATAGLGVLLYIWKSQGIYLAGSLTITLIAGGLFLGLLSLRPIQQRKAPFATCCISNIGVIGLYFVIGTIRGSYRVPISNSLSFGIQPVYYLEGDTEIFSMLFALLWLISLAMLIFCYVSLLWNAVRPIPSALLLLINLGLVFCIMEELIQDGHTNHNRVATLQGYFTAIGILAAPWFLIRLSRWLDSLPTTREEIKDVAEEEEPPPEK